MPEITPDETWDTMFDEIYLTTYAANLGERDSEEEARQAAEFAAVEPGAEILDAPTGFGRHALPLARLTLPANASAHAYTGRPFALSIAF